MELVRLWGDIRKQDQHFLDELWQQLQDLVVKPLEQLHEQVQQSLENLEEAGAEETSQRVQMLKTMSVSFIRNELEKPVDIIIKELKRILTKREAIQSQIRERYRSFEEVVCEGEARFFKMTEAFLFEGDTEELEKIKDKDKQKNSSVNWQTMIDSRWAKAQDQLSVWGRFSRKKGICI